MTTSVGAFFSSFISPETSVADSGLTSEAGASDSPFAALFASALPGAVLPNSDNVGDIPVDPAGPASPADARPLLDLLNGLSPDEFPEELQTTLKTVTETLSIWVEDASQGLPELPEPEYVICRCHDLDHPAPGDDSTVAETAVDPLTGEQSVTGELDGDQVADLSAVSPSTDVPLPVKPTLVSPDVDVLTTTQQELDIVPTLPVADEAVSVIDTSPDEPLPVSDVQLLGPETITPDSVVPAESTQHELPDVSELLLPPDSVQVVSTLDDVDDELPQLPDFDAQDDPSFPTEAAAAGLVILPAAIVIADTLPDAPPAQEVTVPEPAPEQAAAPQILTVDFQQPRPQAEAGDVPSDAAPVPPSESPVTIPLETATATTPPATPVVTLPDGTDIPVQVEVRSDTSSVVDPSPHVLPLQPGVPTRAVAPRTTRGTNAPTTTPETLDHSTASVSVPVTAVPVSAEVDTIPADRGELEVVIPEQSAEPATSTASEPSETASASSSPATTIAATDESPVTLELQQLLRIHEGVETPGPEVSTHEVVADFDGLTTPRFSAEQASAGISSAEPGSSPATNATTTVPVSGQVATAVAQELRLTAGQEDTVRTISIRLDPPELGALRLVLRTTDTGLDVRVEAAEDLTLEMLQTRAPEIEQTLKQQEIDVQRLGVQRLDASGETSVGADANPDRQRESSLLADGGEHGQSGHDSQQQNGRRNQTPDDVPSLTRRPVRAGLRA